MEVKIYQIKDIEKTPYAFLGYRAAKVSGFSMNDYAEVYQTTTAKTNVFEALEDIFTTFNIRRPKDFKGHSLSVSDIVAIEDQLYYCDSWEWVKL